MGHSFRPRPPLRGSSAVELKQVASSQEASALWSGAPFSSYSPGPPGHRVVLPTFRVEWVFPPHVSKCRNSHSHTRTEVSLLCDYTSCQVVNISHSSHVTWKNCRPQGSESPWRASLCPPFHPLYCLDVLQCPLPVL